VDICRRKGRAGSTARRPRPYVTVLRDVAVDETCLLSAENISAENVALRRGDVVGMRRKDCVALLFGGGKC